MGFGDCLAYHLESKEDTILRDCGAQSPGTGGSLTAEVGLVVAWGSILVEGNSLTGRGTHIGSVGVSLSPAALAKVS